MDKVIESNGIKVVYASDLERHLEGLSLDYTEEGMRKGFHFTGGNFSSC
ncbi:MAG: hypothetical protein GX363_06515 [Clostridiales bacterium]|jgi:Fe-S cluster assembly iron-binding protein IscA|nr:hypothetical protein [Clostridiales bacterium]